MNQLKRIKAPITPVATTNPISILTTSGSSLLVSHFIEAVCGEVISCLSVALLFSVDMFSSTNNDSTVVKGPQGLSCLKVKGKESVGRERRSGVVMYKMMLKGGGYTIFGWTVE